MGGKKHKIAIEKIEKKGSRAVTFSKRRQGLYAKASELCLLSGAKMAILATPVSSKSNASFFSFGHSSVDSVVSAFIANMHPQEEEDDIIGSRGLGFWWEDDDSLVKSDDPVKLRAAIDSISKTLLNLKKLRSDAMKNQGDGKKLKKKKMKKDVSLYELDQTLNFGSTSVNLEGFNKKNEEHDQKVAISDKNGLHENFDGCNQKQDIEAFSKQVEMDFAMDDVSMVTTTNQNPCSDSDNVEDLALMIQGDLRGEEFDLDQFIDFDLDQFIDFETNPTELLMIQRDDLDENNLKFSDYFNDLPSITTL